MADASINNDKKVLALHVVIGYLKGTVESDYSSEENKFFAKDLLALINEELEQN